MEISFSFVFFGEKFHKLSLYSLRRGMVFSENIIRCNFDGCFLPFLCRLVCRELGEYERKRGGHLTSETGENVTFSLKRSVFSLHRVRQSDGEKVVGRSLGVIWLHRILLVRIS